MTNFRDEYTAKMHLELDELNTKVDALEAKAHEAQADMREKYRSELLKLRHHSQVASDKVAMLKSSSEEAWDNMVLEMNKVRTAFTQSVNYFKSQF
jgi:hypothetical protein